MSSEERLDVFLAGQLGAQALVGVGHIAVAFRDPGKDAHGGVDFRKIAEPGKRLLAVFIGCQRQGLWFGVNMGMAAQAFEGQEEFVIVLTLFHR